MVVNFKNLEKADFLPFQGDFIENERKSRQVLFDAMQPLAVHDPLNTCFINCCIYSSRAEPIKMGVYHQKELQSFEEKRVHYLKSVLQLAREQYDGEQHLFSLAQKNLRAIDPALIGESRYLPTDQGLVKVFKVMYHFFWSQVYFWMSRETIRTWAARHDALLWGEAQEPGQVFYPSLRHHGAGASGNGFNPQTTRDTIIKDLCLGQLGFPKEDVEALQALLALFPEPIEEFMFHPSLQTFRVVFKKEGIALPDWKKMGVDVSTDYLSAKEGYEQILSLLGKLGLSIPAVLRNAEPKVEKMPSWVTVQISGVQVRFPKLLEGRIVKEEGKPPRLEFATTPIRVEVPAQVKPFSPTLFIDLVSWGRKPCGSMTVAADIGASSGYDGVIKTVVRGLTNPSTTRLIYPKEDYQYLGLLCREILEAISENIQHL